MVLEWLLAGVCIILLSVGVVAKTLSPSEIEQVFIILETDKPPIVKVRE